MAAHSSRLPIPLTFEEGWRPIVRRYVVSDLNENKKVTFELDALVVGFDDGPDPDEYLAVLCVVLLGPPEHFLYSPHGLSSYCDISDEMAIKLALAAYRAERPGAIPALARAPFLRLKEAARFEPTQ